MSVGPSLHLDRSRPLAGESRLEHAYVDAAFLFARQKKRLYAFLKRWGRRSGGEELQVLVFIGKRAIAILPERDVDLSDANVEGKTIYYEKNRLSGQIKVTVEGWARRIAPLPTLLAVPHTYRGRRREAEV